MLNKQEILQQLSINYKTLKKFGVKKIGVFGSFSRNEQTQNSDIDFLIEFFPKQKNFDNYMDLYFYLKTLFNKEIDIKTIKSLPINRNFTQNVLNEVEYAAF
ncbi:MAG: nucleotidyltransferase domain-containing protein [Bacteroidota bacterium]